MDGEWISRKTTLNGGQISKRGGAGGFVVGGGGGPKGDSSLIVSFLIIFVDNLSFIHMLF